MKLILRLLPIVLLVLYSSGDDNVEMKCAYETRDFQPGTAFTCEVSNHVIYTGIKKASIENYGLKDHVEGFSADHKVMYFIPQIINKRFKNIKYLRIRVSKLKKVSKSDLQNWKLLVHLDLSWNEIKFLEANLFDGNLDLHTIWLNNNEIYFIDSNVLQNVNLFYFNINKNACYDGEATADSVARNLIKVRTCQDEFSDILSFIHSNRTDILTTLVLQNTTQDLNMTMIGLAEETRNSIKQNSDRIDRLDSKLEEKLEEIRLGLADLKEKSNSNHRNGQIWNLVTLACLFLLITVIALVTREIVRKMQWQASSTQNVEQSVVYDVWNDGVTSVTLEPNVEATRQEVQRQERQELEPEEDFYAELPVNANYEMIYGYNSNDIYAEVKKK